MNKILRFRFLGIAAFLAMIAVFSIAAMFLWNALMPQIFGLSVISYWQAAGMVILARILFGGLGEPGGHRRFGAYRGRDGEDRLFNHGNVLREKWLNMTDDERKEFMRSRRDFSHFESEKDSPNNEGGKRE